MSNATIPSRTFNGHQSTKRATIDDSYIPSNTIPRLHYDSSYFIPIDDRTDIDVRWIVSKYTPTIKPTQYHAYNATKVLATPPTIEYTTKSTNTAPIRHIVSGDRLKKLTTQSISSDFTTASLYPSNTVRGTNKRAVVNSHLIY